MTDSVPSEDGSLPDPKATRAGGRWKKLWEQLKRFSRPIAAIAAFGAVLSGLLGYRSVYEVVEKFFVPKSAPAVVSPGGAGALVGPPAMSIALLPFAVIGANSVDESLAQSLTKDVIAVLVSSTRYVMVAPYGSVASYQGKPVNPRAAGRDLNVRYLAQGEIRQNGDKVIVTVQMTDAATARQVWSDRLEWTTAQLGTLAITRDLAHRFRAALVDAEIARASRQNGEKADATTLWLRCDAALDGTLNGTLNARPLCDQALRLEPKLVGALGDRFWVSVWLLEMDPQADRARLVGEMEDLSRRAVAADFRDPRAWAVRARALMYQHRWNEASEALDQSLRIDPDRIDVYWTRAYSLIWRGRPQDALSELDKAIAIDARAADDGSMLRARCRAYLSLGRYDDAIKVCERAAPLEDSYLVYLYLTAAYAQNGEMTKAAAAKAQLLKFQPNYTIERYRKLQLSDVPEFWQQTEAHVFMGLRKAGVPEH